MSGIIQKDHGGAVPTIYHWDEHTEQLHVLRTQDVEPLMDLHKAMQSHGHSGWSADRSGVAVANVPITLIEQCLAEGWDPARPENHARFMALVQRDYPNYLIGKQGWMHNGIIVKGAR